VDPNLRDLDSPGECDGSGSLFQMNYTNLDIYSYMTRFSFEMAQGYHSRKKFARKFFKWVYLSFHNYTIVLKLFSSSNLIN